MEQEQKVQEPSHLENCGAMTGLDCDCGASPLSPDQEKLIPVMVEISKLEIKPTDVIILKSKIDQRSVNFVAQTLSIHLGFPVIILLLGENDEIKVMSKVDAPQIFAPGGLR